MYPEVSDIDNVPKTDIEMMLPKPKAYRNTYTKISCLILIFFNISFVRYNIG